MMDEHIKSDDKKFIKWIAENPKGYVINCLYNSCTRFHSANCPTLNTLKRENWTIAPNSKVVSTDKNISELYDKYHLKGELISCKKCTLS